jgi:hypothetical protein
LQSDLTVRGFLRGVYRRYMPPSNPIDTQMGKQNARWSKASDVIPMFPTLVWKIELEAQLREASANS